MDKNTRRKVANEKRKPIFWLFQLHAIILDAKVAHKAHALKCEICKQKKNV